MQGLAIWCAECKGCDLVSEETPLFSDGDILEPGEGDAVEVDGLVLEERNGEQAEEKEVD